MQVLIFLKTAILWLYNGKLNRFSWKTDESTPDRRAAADVSPRPFMPGNAFVRICDWISERTGDRPRTENHFEEPQERIVVF